MKRYLLKTMLVELAVIVLILQSAICCAKASEEEESRDYVEIDVEDFGKTTIQIYEGFDFLNHSSEELQWEQALNAAVLSKAMYDKKAGDVLWRIGYDYIYKPEGSEPQPLNPSITVAYKLIVDEEGRKKNLFAVVVKGTSTWTDIGTDLGDWADMFESSEHFTAKSVLTAVTELTGKTFEELKQEDNYFFLTGHSLGGAVANRLSVNNDIIMELVKKDKNKIYTYTFESPHTCTALFFMHVDEMSNAFNFKDSDDGIAKWVPTFAATTFGQDVSFSVHDLNGGILKALFPETTYEDLTKYNTFLCHHNIIGDIVYIIQNGHLIDDYQDRDTPAKQRLSEKVVYSRKDEKESWRISSKEIYRYDDQGRLIERKTVLPNGDVEEIETYTFDKDGHLSEKIQTHLYADYSKFDIEWYFRECKYIGTYYNAEGDVTSIKGWLEDGSIETEVEFYRHDKEKRKIEYDIKVPFMDGVMMHAVSGCLYYDEKGRTVRVETWSNGGNCLLSGEEYEYDSNGNVILERHLSQLSGAYPIAVDEVIRYERNEQGDLIGETHTDASGDSWSYKYEVLYDGNRKTIIDHEAEAQTYWEYSDDGRLIKEGGSAETIYSWKREYEYNDMGNVEEEVWARLFTYFDSDGEIQDRIEEMTSTRYIYENLRNANPQKEGEDAGGGGGGNGR